MAAEELSRNGLRVGPLESHEAPYERCYQRLSQIEAMIAVIHMTNGEFYNMSDAIQGHYLSAIRQLASAASVDLHLVHEEARQ